ncbi:MAG: mechanosensitive ion channel [Atopobiaceae bacterium]|jgi:small-conductance mechanosensitive channel|nr:mechanosensitive ion channel [Atopobiaceae bacterium]MBQ9317285.1 mechanosensitive ion channel [Atopobiaceae bacterium]
MGTRIAGIGLIDSLSQTYGEVPVAILVTSLTICIALIASHRLNGLLHRRLTGSGTGEITLMLNIARVVIALIAVYFLSENVFHVEMSGVMQALGVTTLVVSLGLQDLIKSVVAGILIVAGNIVGVGDQVIMGDHRGEVMDVNWHQITIRDRDGIAHIIPNSKLIGDNFMRLQGKMACRHMFECTIAPGANLPMVKTDIETLAANVLTKRGWIAQGYSPQVMFMGSTALGTTASIRIFISDIEYAVRSMDAVMCAISDRGYLADVRQDTKPEWR